MLRCLKWPLWFGPLIAILCFGIGWIFGKPPEKVSPPKTPVVEKMTYTFNGSSYDVSGKPIATTVFATDKKTQALVTIYKEDNPVGTKRFITVKPDDKAHYQERTFEITWRNQTQFLAWLKGDFTNELRAKGADLQKWQPILKKLSEIEASDTSCNFPILIDRK